MIAGVVDIRPQAASMEVVIKGNGLRQEVLRVLKSQSDVVVSTCSVRLKIEGARDDVFYAAGLIDGVRLMDESVGSKPTS